MIEVGVTQNVKVGPLNNKHLFIPLCIMHHICLFLFASFESLNSWERPNLFSVSLREEIAAGESKFFSCTPNKGI